MRVFPGPHTTGASASHLVWSCEGFIPVPHLHRPSLHTAPVILSQAFLLSPSHLSLIFAVTMIDNKSCYSTIFCRFHPSAGCRDVCLQHYNASVFTLHHKFFHTLRWLLSLAWLNAVASPKTGLLGVISLVCRRWQLTRQWLQWPITYRIDNNALLLELLICLQYTTWAELVGLHKWNLLHPTFHTAISVRFESQPFITNAVRTWVNRFRDTVTCSCLTWC